MGVMRRVPGEAGEKLKRAMADLDNANVRVGWFESAKYNDENKTPVAYVAAINELGPHARPFMRTAKDDNERDWIRDMEMLSKQIIKGRLTALEALELLGFSVGADIKRKIASIQDPRLSLVTLMARKAKLAGETINKSKIVEFIEEIAREGASNIDVSGISTKPLNDSGYMLATLSASVDDGAPVPIPDDGGIAP